MKRCVPRSPSVSYAATFVNQATKIFDFVWIAYAGTAKEEGETTLIRVIRGKIIIALTFNFPISLN